MRVVVLAVLGALAGGCATGHIPGEPGDDPDAGITVPGLADASPSPSHPDASPPPPPPPMIDAAPPPCTPTWTNLLANTAFDLGATAWTQSSTGGYPIIVVAGALPIVPQSGSYAAWMAGYDSAYDQIYQPVVVPAGATSLRMSGWRCIASDETPGGGVYDVAGVGILDASSTPLETLASFSNEDSVSPSGCTWAPFSATAAGVYAGQSVIFFLEASTDSLFATSFFFDSFTFEALVCQ